MTSRPFKPSVEELQYLFAATLITAAGYAAYRQSFKPQIFLFYGGVSLLILLTREFGQRAVAHWMDADIELHLSWEGSLVTAFGALVAIITSAPFLLLFPVFNSFSTERYEQWGKSVDVIWPKRKFWLVSGGILTMMVGWALSYSSGFFKVSEAFSLFLMFQLMPFDYSKIPTGTLDGSVVLRQSGFIWLLYFLITWVTLGAVWV